MPPQVALRTSSRSTAFGSRLSRGIEQLLVKQVPTSALRSFLDEVVQREDYPTKIPYEASQVSDGDLAAFAAKVLKARKGDGFGVGYTGTLIEQCQTEAELPTFIRDALLVIDEQLKGEPELILDEESASPDPVSTESEE